MSASLDPFPDAVASGAVLELPEDSFEPTNPFSTGHVENRILESLQHETKQSGSTSIEARLRSPESCRAQRDCPIASLQSTHLDCRLLFQPVEIHGIAIAGAEPATLFPTGAQSGCGVSCLAVRESPEHTSRSISGPLPCEVHFDPYQDSVLVFNKAAFPLQVSPSDHPNPAEGEPEGQFTIDAYSTAVVTVGSWKFGPSNGPHVFQALIRPRTRVLEVMALSLQRIAGSKRGAAEQDATIESTIDGSSGTVARQLDCIGDLVEGEVARFHASDVNNDTNFTLFRMRRIGETRSAIVFQARHSGHAKEVIVVKAFKRSSNRDALARGRSWLNEYKVHLGIQSDNIVKLLGGDARVHALFLERIDARDLSSWCDFKIDKKFRGTDADALLVLRDMAQALQYLRGKRILHNDIKPSNILYCGKKAVLIDFGLGTFDGSSASSGGTPWYVGPEYLYHKERKAPCDVWALGVVALYLRRRIRLPDTGVDIPSWTIREIGLSSSANKHMKGWLKLVEREALAIDLADELGELIARMLDDRPASRITPDELIIQYRRLDLGFDTNQSNQQDNLKKEKKPSL
ncbi:kinase-like protein [Astrocystis sublimbata]|nr:kinase-like protein [Astrocystis sublimbata]